MQIALYQPDIPQNTGTVLRLCACLGVAAHIIAPAGFPISDRLFRRAGMDYLDRVSWMRHDSWTKFEAWRAERAYRLLLFLSFVVFFFLVVVFGVFGFCIRGHRPLTRRISRRSISPPSLTRGEG